MWNFFGIKTENLVETLNFLSLWKLVSTLTVFSLVTRHACAGVFVDAVGAHAVIQARLRLTLVDINYKA